MGRESLLTDEMAERCRDYVQNYKDYGDTVPSLSGLSRHIGVSLSTIKHRWPDHSPDIFLPIKEDLLAEQERALLNGGLDKSFNSNVAMMLLSRHGYATKTESTVNGTMNNVNYTPEDYKKAQAELDEALK